MVTFIYVFLSIVLITIYPWFKRAVQQLIFDIVLEIFIPIIKNIRKFLEWITRKFKRKSS